MDAYVVEVAVRQGPKDGNDGVAPLNKRRRWRTQERGRSCSIGKTTRGRRQRTKGKQKGEEEHNSETDRARKKR